MSRQRRKISWFVEGAGRTGVYRARHMAGAKAAFRRQFRVSATRHVSARVATLAEAEVLACLKGNR